MEKQFEHRLTEVEERSKSNTHRLAKVEERQDNLEKLAVSVEKIAIREENVENDVKEIKCDVKSLTSKSGKKWDDLVGQIIAIAVAAIAGFILAKIGL